MKTAHDNDVKFIRLWFTDILGFLKSFAITINELEDALEEGVHVGHGTLLVDGAGVAALVGLVAADAAPAAVVGEVLGIDPQETVLNHSDLPRGLAEWRRR